MMLGGSPTRLTLIALALGAAMLLPGCSTTWSTEQRTRLTHVVLTGATVADHAYQKPDAKESPRMAEKIPQATMGGLIPALIGSAIDKSVTSHQQQKFEASDSTYFAALEKAFGPVPTTEIDAAFRQVLQHHRFFSSRISDQGGAVFSVRIVRYGLNKSPLSKGEEIWLRVAITAEVKLTEGNEEFFRAEYTGVARLGARSKDILGSSDFFVIGRREAAEDLFQQVVNGLDIKVGR